MGLGQFWFFSAGWFDANITSSGQQWIQDPAWRAVLLRQLSAEEPCLWLDSGSQGAFACEDSLSACGAVPGERTLSGATSSLASSPDPVTICVIILQGPGCLTAKLRGWAVESSSAILSFWVLPTSQVTHPKMRNDRVRPGPVRLIPSPREEFAGVVFFLMVFFIKNITGWS